MKNVVLLVFLLLASFVRSESGEEFYEQAKKAHKSKDYEKMIIYLEKGCNAGNFAACSNLGVAYKKGEGVKQDFIQANKFYEKACNAGNASGCFNLGNSYHEGRGVKIDYAQANKFYKQACNLGSAESCLNLGRAYAIGEGIEKDYLLSHKLYESSCDAGLDLGCKSLIVSSHNLAIEYINGAKNAKDKNQSEEYLNQAKSYLKKACNLGDEEDCNAVKEFEKIEKNKSRENPCLIFEF